MRQKRWAKLRRKPALMHVLILLLVSCSRHLHGFLMISSAPSASSPFRLPPSSLAVDIEAQRSPRSCSYRLEDTTNRLRSTLSSSSSSSSSSQSLLEMDGTTNNSLRVDLSPLSLSIDELSQQVFEGRTHPARQLWKAYYRHGIDPFESSNSVEEGGSDDESGASSSSSSSSQPLQTRRRDPLLLGGTSLRQLRQHFGGRSLRESVADLASVSTSSNDDGDGDGDSDGDGDGTTKLLITLRRDGRQVEAVIIPWWRGEEKEDRDGAAVVVDKDSSTQAMLRKESTTATAPSRSEYSTLCVSSQVGCRQACSFCRTGMQGLARSLTADEILAQVVLANAVIHSRGLDTPHQGQGESTKRRRRLPVIGNVVFMGMGEPADNARAVVTATERLVDPHQFALPPKRITVSTVSPSPDAFRQLLGMAEGWSGDDHGDTGAQLAWSLHSSRNEVRKLLVPTTKHTVEELREGLIDTLRRRSRKRRSVLIEMTMLDSVNHPPRRVLF
jgi:adenine C2-methylase RlmN of 23S rRNA A2503 and tRNA A37